MEFIDTYLNDLKKCLDSLPRQNIAQLFNALMDAHRGDRNVLTMGNGGSASTASHFACDINKGVCINLEKKLRVICLNDNVATMMAYANDFSYDDIFLEQIKTFLKPKDLVIGFSGSGNSPNVLRAIDYANKAGAVTFGLTGYDGGKLAKLAQMNITTPIHDMQKTEDSHLILTHLMMQMLCRELDPTALSCYRSPSKP